MRLKIRFFSQEVFLIKYFDYIYKMNLKTEIKMDFYNSQVNLFLGIVFCLVFTASGTITKVVDNGPDSNRVVFVVFGDGYTQEQMERYHRDVDTIIVKYFFSMEPFKTYKNFFNIYRFDTTSVDSGTYTSPEYKPNTVFGSSVVIGGGTASASLENGALLTTLANRYVPAYTKIFCMINYHKRAGGAGPTIAAFTRGDGNNYQTALHEMGHCFGLVDEYSLGAPGIAHINAPNAAGYADTAIETLKWKDWLTPGVPIPTPSEGFTYDYSVGVFAGAVYSNDCYRPESYCMMGNATNSFCRVCTEWITLKLHEKISIIEPVTPTNGTVYYNVQPITFTLSLVEAGTIQHSAVTWLLDYTPIANECTTSVTLQPWDLGQSFHVLQAVVTDTTGYIYRGYDTTRFVRNDPNNLMSDTITWNLQYGWGTEVIQLAENQPLTGIAWTVTGYGGRNVSIKTDRTATMRIYDIRGRLLQSFFGNGTAVHNWQAPSAGAYFIRLDSRRNNQTRRVIVR